MVALSGWYSPTGRASARYTPLRSTMRPRSTRSRKASTASGGLGPGLRECGEAAAAVAREVEGALEAAELREHGARHRSEIPHQKPVAGVDREQCARVVRRLPRSDCDAQRCRVLAARARELRSAEVVRQPRH